MLRLGALGPSLHKCRAAAAAAGAEGNRGTCHKMPRIQPIRALDAGLNISGRFLDNMVLDLSSSHGVEL